MDEAAEEGMGGVWFGLELRMILAGEEPGVIAKLDKLDERTVGRSAGDDESPGFHLLPIAHVEFVPVAMALGDLGGTVKLVSAGAFRDMRWPGAQSHGGPFFGHIFLRLQKVDDRMRRDRIELRAVGALESADVAGEFNRGDLHPET